MASLAALATAVFAFATLSVPAVAGSNYSLIAVSSSGLMHLDSGGSLLAWRPENNMEGQVATIPDNGTVCWVTRRGDIEVGSLVRCAQLSRINETWDLPLPLSMNIGAVKAFDLDQATRSWYLTVEAVVPLLKENGDTPLELCRSYVCSYGFETCLTVAEFGPSACEDGLVAYDMSNRLMFFITFERLSYRLQSMQLDGSDLRELGTRVREPYALALDPARRLIYWTDRTASGKSSNLTRVDYDGKNRKDIRQLETPERLKSLDAVGDIAILVRKDKKVITVVNADTGELTDIVSGSVRSTSTAIDVDKILGVHVVSSEKPLNSENPCSSEAAGCQDFCIPMTANNSRATATCFCPKGLRLVDFECRKEHPSYALVIGTNTLQVVDLQTEGVTTVLSNLTDGTRVDVYREADSEFLLFWLDAGSLYRGRWSPGASVKDVELLVQAADDVPVVEMAIYASQQQLLLMKKDDSDASAGSKIVVQMSPLDGSYFKTVFVSSWKDEQDHVVHGDVFLLIHNRFVRQRSFWVKFAQLGPDPYCLNSTMDIKDLAGVVMDEPISQEPEMDRVFWIDRASRSIDYLYSIWSSYTWLVPRRSSSLVFHRHLLSHPSLADAGGLDVADSRLFWTERSSGLLWTADRDKGAGVRSLPGVTAGRSLRLIQPWRRPESEPVCDDSGCSHFCLRYKPGLVPRPAVAQCDCPDGMELGDDKKTCRKVTVDTSEGKDNFPRCKRF